MKISKLLASFLFLAIPLKFLGQGIQLSNSVICLDTSNFNFTLASANKEFLNAKIVLLGEAGHGDGMTFEMKTKFVKYLVTTCGFNAIALEGGGFIETPYALRNIAADSSIYTEFEKMWDEKWSKSVQTKELIRFISDEYKKGKLNIFGIETQPLRSIYTNSLFPYLKSARPQCLPKVDSMQFEKFTTDLFRYYNATIESPLDMTEAEIISMDSLAKVYINGIKRKSVSCAFFKQNLLNISSNLEIFIFNVKEEGYANESVNIRDSVMAANLIWHLDHNPKTKVIVWAANFHIIKNLSQITNNYDSLKYHKITTMGKYLNDKYAGKTFSIAFTSASGQEGFCNDTATYNIEENAQFPIDSSVLENALKCNNCDYTFYNFKEDQVLQQKKFRSLIFGANMHKGYWAKAFDAVVYIDKQKRSVLRKSDR